MRIIHLSDLHFGDEYFLYSLSCKRWYKYKHDPVILQNLANAVVDLQPDAIIVSGDVVSKDRPISFHEAAQFLQAIVRRLNKSIKKSLIVVPGNHDAPILGRLTEDKLDRIRGFRSFLAQLYGISVYDARERDFWIFPQHKVCIFGFDSTLKGKTESQKTSFEDVIRVSEGAIGDNQLHWYRETHSDLYECISDFESYYKIAVLHHHPFPLTNQNLFMQLDDAGPFLECLSQPRNNINMILHGHKHVPAAAERSYTTHPFVVISAGTALFKIPAEQGPYGNNFNLISIENTKVVCTRYKADNNKRFVPESNDGKIARYEFPNHKTVSVEAWTTGVFTDEIRKVLNLHNAKNDDYSIVELWHKGFNVVKPDKTVKEIPKRMTASNALARIENIELIPEGTNMDRLILDKRGEGTNSATYRIIFKEALTNSSDPVDFSVRWRIRGATCMERARFGEYYPGDQSYEEDTTCDFLFPVRNFSMLILFPHRYIVAPAMELTEHGAIKDRRPLEYDYMRHSVECSLNNLTLGMKCRVAWPLPE